MLHVAGLTVRRGRELQSISGTIALVGTLAYVLMFAVGVGPVPGILVSEINAAAIRGAAFLVTSA